MPVITKLEIVRRVAQQTGVPLSTVRPVVQEALDTISRQLIAGDDVCLKNFGAFFVIRRLPKVGRNPRKPDQDIPIPACTVVKFKPGKVLKRRVNKP